MAKIFDGIGARIGTLKFSNGDETALFRSDSPNVFIIQETRVGYYDHNMEIFRYPYGYQREIDRNGMYQFCSEYFGKAPEYCSCEFWTQRRIVDQRDQLN